MSDERRVVTDDGVGLSVRVLGSGDDVVIIPGAASDEDFAPFAAPDRTLVFFDSRNRGRSDAVDSPAKLGFRREVGDIEVVRRELGLERVSLIGWSYLGAVIVHYAMAEPERVERLVMVSPIAVHADVPLEPNPQPPPHLLARLDQLEAEGLKEADPAEHCREWRRIYVPRLLADPERFADLRNDPCDCPNEWPDHMMQAMAHIFLDLDEWDWRGQLSGVTTPALVVFGGEDTMPLWAAREWTAELPVARLLAFDGVGRMPWVERPDEFGSAVDSFLRGAWPAGAA